MLKNIFLFLSLLSTTFALYGPKSHVVQVGADNFKDEVMKFDGVAIVEFYAPWCGHCKQLTPEYEKAASILKGVVKVVAIDATAHESLAQKYQIQGFPTLKIFGADKRQPVDYSGQRTADAIVSETMKAANQLVKDRKGGKSKPADAGGEKSSGSGKAKGKASKSDVVELNEMNFNALVMESNDHWLVEFYAPWCGHCKKLAPEWEKAATSLKSQGVKLGAVDATAATALAQKYGVKGYPTIKVFPAGPKGAPQDYNGPREADGIVEFALSSLENAGAPLLIPQITSATLFENTCGRAKLCAIMFLPHILDSGAAGRNAYLDTFREVNKEFRKMPIAFVWSEGTAQPALESALNVNGNFPTIAVLSTEKKVGTVMRVSWTKKNIQTFIQGVLSGGEKTSALTVPAVETVSEWDGKDAKLESNEISLDELFSDDNEL